MAASIRSKFNEQKKKLLWLIANESPSVSINEASPKDQLSGAFSHLLLNGVEEKNICICNLCRQLFTKPSNSNSNLRAHLWRRHPKKLFDSADEYLAQWKLRTARNNEVQKTSRRKRAPSRNASDIKTIAPLEEPLVMEAVEVLPAEKIPVKKANLAESGSPSEANRPKKSHHKKKSIEPPFDEMLAVKYPYRNPSPPPHKRNQEQNPNVQLKRSHHNKNPID